MTLEKYADVVADLPRGSTRDESFIRHPTGYGVRESSQSGSRSTRSMTADATVEIAGGAIVVSLACHPILRAR